MSGTLIVIPVYNAEVHLGELIERLAKQFDRQHSLFINDGSTDSSESILKQQGCRFLTFKSNRGKGEALRAGIRYAVKYGYDYLITMDADLQHRPEELARFLTNHPDDRIMVGQRQFAGTSMPWHRRLSNRMTSALISIFSRSHLDDSQCGFRLIPLKTVARLKLESDGYQTESELLLKADLTGARITQVPISTIYHRADSSVRNVADTLRFIRLLWQRLWY